MKPNINVHTPDDGRGPRDVLLNGKHVDRVIYADTRKGIIRVVGDPIKIDKRHKRVLWKTLRGKVEVLRKDGSDADLPPARNIKINGWHWPKVGADETAATVSKCDTVAPNLNSTTPHVRERGSDVA